MNDQKDFREWSSTEKLPEGFVKWMKAIVTERGIEQKKSFMHIADELGVEPSSLSRWLGGMGPLNQKDIHALATNISPTVYTLLQLPWPNNP